MLVFEGQQAKFIRFFLKFRDYKDKSGRFIGRGSSLVNTTEIDIGTRFNGVVKIKGKGVCRIGKYGAFGDQVTLISSNHKTDNLNLQYALSRKLGIPIELGHRSGITIGHNVWVGDHSIILPGVTVGNGAIIGAGSVVTKDVKAYSITAGNPARFIKYRLTEREIEEAEASRWWDWTLPEMKANKRIFLR